MAEMITVHVYQEVVAYDSNSQEEYRGWAAPGTAANTAQWQIRKITYTSNLETAKTWAEHGSFTNRWDTHATADYY